MRKTQLIDEGISPDIDIDAELYHFFMTKLEDQSLIQLLMIDQDEIVASGAILIFEFPPTYTNKSGKKAYVTNMYTRNEYRGKGIATRLLTMLVDETKLLGISKMWLGASKFGSPVYKRFGFDESGGWMELNV